jgi:hypothetical protein
LNDIRFFQSISSTWAKKEGKKDFVLFPSRCIAENPKAGLWRIVDGQSPGGETQFFFQLTKLGNGVRELFC